MIETMFRVLMHSGRYVDTNLLEKGIYITSIPMLYSKNSTIEDLERQGRINLSYLSDLSISEKYFENLRLCELVDVSLVHNV